MIISCSKNSYYYYNLSYKPVKYFSYFNYNSSYIYSYNSLYSFSLAIFSCFSFIFSYKFLRKSKAIFLFFSLSSNLKSNSSYESLAIPAYVFYYSVKSNFSIKGSPFPFAVISDSSLTSVLDFRISLKNLQIKGFPLTIKSFSLGKAKFQALYILHKTKRII